MSIEAVRDEIQSLERSGTLLRLPSPDHDPRWTTPTIVVAEATLIRAADRQLEPQWFDPAAVRDALEQAPHLAEEQRRAVEHAASQDGVSVIEAGAGTGNTTLSKALVDAARRSGLTVVGLAPSWVAADELSKSTGITAVALAKWRHEQSSERKSALSERHLVIVDEAGMASTRELAAVLQEAAEARAKVVFVGDRTQLASVAGASALRAVVDVVGRHATLTQVRRQQVDWQRAASTLMATGDVEAGLRGNRTHPLHGPSKDDRQAAEPASHALVIASPKRDQSGARHVTLIACAVTRSGQHYIYPKRMHAPAELLASP